MDAHKRKAPICHERAENLGALAGMTLLTGTALLADAHKKAEELERVLRQDAVESEYTAYTDQRLLEGAFCRVLEKTAGGQSLPIQKLLATR